MVRAYKLAVTGMLAVALLVLPACSTGGGGGGVGSDPGDLTGVTWALVKVGAGTKDLSASGITAVFSDKTISGFSGVNQYGGSYNADRRGGFSVGGITTTMMAGPEDLMKVEQAYLAVLAECDSYRVDGGTLTLSTGGEEALVFQASTPASLPGSSWLVTGYNNGSEAVVTPSLGSTLTLEFETDVKASGSSGVNTFNGPYSSSATTLSIGPFAMTRMAGTPELMAQETAYLNALQASAKWSITQGRLELRDLSGAMQVTAVATK